MISRSIALHYATKPIGQIAYGIAEYCDPEFKETKKKIEEQIRKHEDAIKKLNAKLEKAKREAAERCIPVAERKKEEAKQFIAAYDKCCTEMVQAWNKSKYDTLRGR